MGLQATIVLLLCLWVSFEYCVQGLYNTPQILGESEYILQANQNHSLFCQGNSPLKWSQPQVKEHQKGWTKFQTKSETPTDSQYNYGLRLYITNMSFPFVGYYDCYHESALKDSDTESTKVYLFVNDEDHLSVWESEHDIPEIVVTQRETAVIPCRPTSPYVSVDLSSWERDIGLNVLNEDLIIYHYDQHIGIITNDTEESDEYVHLICQFRRNNTTISQGTTLLVEKPISHLPMPELKDISDDYTVIGGTLTLKCSIRTATTTTFKWETPQGLADNMRMTTRFERDNDNDLNSHYLTITNTTLRDNGIYTCKVSDFQGHHNNVSIKVKIFDKEEYFIKVAEPNDNQHIVTHAGKEEVRWEVDLDGHPKPGVKWIFERTKEVISSHNKTHYKIEFNHRQKKAVLVIKNISINDMGFYVLKVSNKYKEEQRRFFLNVTDKPTVNIEVKPFYSIGTQSIVKCSVTANPEPNIAWKYKPCVEDCHYEPLRGTLSRKYGFLFTSVVKIKANQSGSIKCIASNLNGTAEAVSGFVVSDVENGFDVFGFDDKIVIDEKKNSAIVAVGEPISMTCGASSYNYTDVTWFFNGEVVSNDDRHRTENSYTILSRKSKIEITQSRYADSGLYSCRINDKGRYLYKNVTVRVNKAVVPNINQTNLKQEISINIPDKLEMICKVYGIPKPILTWYKDGNKFSPLKQRIQISDSRDRILFNYTEAEDEGEYECRAENNVGKDSKFQYIKFKNLPTSQTWPIIIIVLLTILFFVALIFIIIKTKKERDLRRELKKIGLANFQDGEVGSINPNLGIDEQAELLPYDKKWEFPIEKLKLGKQLGSGAFGVVMKGEAKNIIDEEDVTIVAVKMVKKNADRTYIKALASELKVMVHLGKHLNVVNLLGACTKNVAKRELLVIVEFCRYGNVQNYLIRHRNNFVNQVDSKTGNIDQYIGQEYLDRTYSISSNNSNPHSPLLNYAALAFSDNNSTQALPPQNSMGDYRRYNSGNTQMTSVPLGKEDEEGVITSNNSVQPEWRYNYRGDYKGQVKPISTSDLLAWSFQVARGMEYLASRKVLHGDLAARNILLSDNNIVKICDFGLAKSMYKSDNYKKSGNCPLPVKWMAIESIRDRVFSTQSDVWSFGIVLWEFFSLGRTPYPGMETNERLYYKLVEGYRMESPEYAPKPVYQMMTECWSAKPLARPTFTKLAEKLGNLLEDSLRQHYIDLNDPYLKMNTQRLEDGQNDYLAMLSPPTFELLSSPQYDNDDVTVSHEEETDDYLSMTPNLIFSPRVTDEEVFNFNTNNGKHRTSESGNACEMLPMLNTVNESDPEMPESSPFPEGNSVSNPTYHSLPTSISDEKTDARNVDGSKNIVATADNYVNMSKIKNNLNENSMNNNPFLGVNNRKQEVHYVNANTKSWGKQSLTA